MTAAVVVPIASFDDALRAHRDCRRHNVPIDRFVIAHDAYPGLRRDPRLAHILPFPAGQAEQLLNIPLQRVPAHQLPSARWRTSAFPTTKE